MFSLRRCDVLILMVLVAACPADETTTTDPAAVTAPKTVVTRQERIDAAEFEAVAELLSLAGGMDLVEYGVLEDTAGSTVIWGEAASGEAALQFCDADGACDTVRQTIGADGTLTWTDGAGASVTPRSAGKPRLLKDLQGNDLTGKTVLALELDKAQLPQVDFERREFHLLNTFGPSLDVNLDGIESTVNRHGGFHNVSQTPYVREGMVLDLLRDLDGMDAVVWLSQGVRQEVVTGSEYKTVGLTVNRAAFGEATLNFQSMQAAADGNVASGPGLLILAASNSYSDGSAGQPAQGSIWKTLDDGERTLVGIQGHADVNRVIAAVDRFVDLYLTGDVGLADALDQANQVFAGTSALLRTNKDGLRSYLKSYEALWTEAGYTPSSARLTTFIVATPYCDGAPQLNSFASAWADVTFDGAFFSGTRSQKVDNNYSTDTHVRGVVTGLEIGDRVLVEFWGDLDKAQFQDTYGFGEGVIVGVKTLDNGDIEVSFNGDAHTTPYVDDAGRECVWSSPKLTTTTSVPSTLLLTP